MSKVSEKISEDASRLLEMARKKFGRLNKAEEKLFCSFADGEIADYSAEKEKDNDPAMAGKWGRERILDADHIFWLCTDRRASELATHNGIKVIGARIEGELDLSDARISFPLDFEKSAFPASIDLTCAEIRNMNLGGTHTGPIYGDGLKVEGYVFLRNGFKAGGEVSFINATIGGAFDCSGGMFINKGATALNVCGVDIKGNILLRYGFRADGEVSLRSATVGGILDCGRGQFINNGASLSADGLEVRGDVFLRGGLKAEGEVNIFGATIGGNLECDGSQFINKGATALNANGANVKGNVFLRNGFKAEGEVCLRGGTIDGALQCDKGQFIKPDGVAFRADRLEVKGDVLLRNGFRAKGEVRLRGATIGGSLQCDKGQFINKGGYTLSVDSMKVQGHVFLRDGFKAEGVVDLAGATIDGLLEWREVNSPEDVTLDLRSARIGTLLDDANSWPDPNKLYLHGLVYDQLADGAPRDAESRIDWLRRQVGFWPQPYEQLAAVLGKGGQDEDARKILIAKDKDRSRLTRLTMSEIIWYRGLWPMLGYGYRPLNALRGALVFVALGWILFSLGYWGRLITPYSESAYVDISVKTDDGEIKRKELSKVYPKFNFLVYSVDTFVPLIDLHQSKYWLPNANRGPKLLNIKGVSLHVGGLLRFYLWIHIVMGWLLSSLFIIGLRGLMQKKAVSGP